MHAPKNVTFCGVRRKCYKNYSSSSDASDEDFSSEVNGDPRSHLGGGSKGGAKPHHKTPPLGGTGHQLASGCCPSGGPKPRLFRWQGRDRPYGGAPRHWPRLTSILMAIGLSYRGKWTML